MPTETETGELAGREMQAFAGCAVRPRSLPELFEHMQAMLASGTTGEIIGHHNLHSLYLANTDPVVRRFYEQCRDCYIDGVGVLWLFHLAGVRERKVQRFSLMDCLPELLTMAERSSLRLFYFGGSPTSVEHARKWIKGQWPELHIQLLNGYVADNTEVVAQINAFAPDLLLVGLGMPKQESWILQQRTQLKAGILLQAGGTLDYYSGEQAQPPASWSQRGFGWLYRLLHDPRRLWKRYLITPWRLLPAVWRLRRGLSEERRRQTRETTKPG
ncbi:MAG: glycosyltransferase [Haliea sp.]|jgi:N-acetylglucosaminyldiphosphoundecaprenol N-acetyl-beta-D-mannosaminyltransferase|uniref:WecB/TagA/CpsF family glycosyltransferase n=1 Tax=Haliea sp. TaxID=1932666 RepID=UPI000C521038|nr:WecB/TagA/CpsF family glycosyltransferase [Haliea sp.]MBM68592.1 glycosyltransferase [Haliea sp.]|tara:strand:+ start:17067 stop:17882 length:816 start_codon:yes stop_codon:yes gene_type:complete